MNVITVITAHTSRAAAATRLALEVDGTVFMDDGTLGEPGNTRRALRWAEQQKASHVIVLQDDALPVPGFLELARAAIAERPEHITSYYLGTGRPRANHIAALVTRAEQQRKQWIETPVYWGVAWSLPTTYLPALNSWLAQRDGPTDTEVVRWARVTQTPCTATWPSLVDHTDGPSLIHPDKGIERKAWRVLA